MLAQHPLWRFDFKSAAGLGLLAHQSRRTEKRGKEGPVAVDCSADSPASLSPSTAATTTTTRSLVPADPPRARTVGAPPRRWQRDPASPGRSQPLTRCGRAGTLESAQSRQQLAPDDVLPGDVGVRSQPLRRCGVSGGDRYTYTCGRASTTLENAQLRQQLAPDDALLGDAGVRSWPLVRKPRGQLAVHATEAGRNRDQRRPQSATAAVPSLATRRGLTISVDTGWSTSKDGIARIIPSAASRLLKGGNAGSTSRMCSSCAGDSSRATTKPSSAKRVGKGDLDNASPSFSLPVPTSTSWRQKSTASMSVLRQIPTDSTTCAGSAGLWPPHDRLVDSQSEGRAARVQDPAARVQDAWDEQLAASLRRAWDEQLESKTQQQCAPRGRGHGDFRRYRAYSSVAWVRGRGKLTCS